MAEIGTELIPLMVDLAHFTKDEVVPAFRELFTTIKDNRGVLDAFAVGLAYITGGPMAAAHVAAEHAIRDQKELVEAWNTAAGGMGKAADDMIQRVGPPLGLVAFASEGVGTAAKDMAKDVKVATGGSADYYEALKDSVVEDTNDMISSAFDPLNAALDAQAGHFAILAANQARSSAKGAADVVAANQDIVGALEDQASNLSDLGDRHELTAKQVDQYESDVKASYAAIGKKVPPEINKVIKRLRILAGFDGTTVHIGVNIAEHVGISNKSGGAGKKHALGGYIPAYSPEIVGDRGPEIFTPTSSGWITPNSRLSAGAPNISFTYAPQYSTASVAEARAFVRSVIPELRRELAAQRTT
jgi:hypothetical protein